jgi:hypothetical protein
VPQLLRAGALDYLVLDYLAEITMSVLAGLRAKHPDEGYAREFTDWVWARNLELIAGSGVRLVTNAGGVNPFACRKRLSELATRAGLKFRIAVVAGDDLMPELPALCAAAPREMYSGQPFPRLDSVKSVNAYLGAFGIARALASGAQVVITGRVVDSALALGPLVHEFGWDRADYDRLAAGTLVGHILECGAQATGGLFTDWESVPDWAHIGYPIAECSADGSFVLTKPEGTGGLCTPATVGEQLVYEIGDPQAYVVPDVVCDFSQVQMRQEGPERVRVCGARGYPPTDTYKVCLTFEDGLRLIALIPVLGRQAAAKALRVAQALIERTNEILENDGLAPFRAWQTDVLGAECTYGRWARTRQSREVVARISVEHDDRRALELLQREWSSPFTSMAAGSTSWYGNQPRITRIVRLFSFLRSKNGCPMHVDMDGVAMPVDVTPLHRFESSLIRRPEAGADPDSVEDYRCVPLIDLAWARSGDKGDNFNVGVLARDPRFLPFIRKALTPEAVHDFLAHEFAGSSGYVERFDLPGVHGLNFLFHKALGGGGAASMRTDMLAKGKAQQLLEFPVPVSREIAAKFSHSQDERSEEDRSCPEAPAR